MELKITTITTLILFLINSVFSLVYKNNIQSLVNASNDTYYSPIFSKDSKKEIDVIRAQNEEDTKQEEEPQNANQPINYTTYTQPTPAEQPTAEQPQDSPPPSPPSEEPKEEEPEGSIPLPDIYGGPGG